MITTPYTVILEMIFGKNVMIKWIIKDCYYLNNKIVKIYTLQMDGFCLYNKTINGWLLVKMFY